MVVRHGTGPLANLPVPRARHSIRRLGRYRLHGSRICLTGPNKMWKRTDRKGGGRDKLGESGDGSICSDPSTHSRS